MEELRAARSFLVSISVWRAKSLTLGKRITTGTGLEIRLRRIHRRGSRHRWVQADTQRLPAGGIGAQYGSFTEPRDIGYFWVVLSSISAYVRSFQYYTFRPALELTRSDALDS